MMSRCNPIIDPGTLLTAYSQGLFPMADPETRELGWYTADPRGIIELDEFHVPRRLERSLRSAPFQIRFDTAFVDVVKGCADRESTWISPLVIRSYERLHQIGFAHSIETWQAGELAGGIYGVSLRGAFFGESMFHRVSDASKAALVALVNRLRDRDFRLFDIQMVTPATAPFGARLIGRREYQRRLVDALQLEREF